MNVATGQRVTQSALASRGASFAVRREVLDNVEIRKAIGDGRTADLSNAQQFALVDGEVWINEISLGGNYDPATCLWERVK